MAVTAKALKANTAKAARVALAKAGGDIVIADFEGAAYPPGWATTGTAFGSGPAHGAIGGQQAVTGFIGRGLVNSFFGGDDTATGTLTSPPFTINRGRLSFLIGGGRHPAEEHIDLLVNGAVVRTATPSDSEQLAWTQWDVEALRGKSAVIQIVDSATGQWGHINIDAITLTDTKLPDERTRLLASATTAIRAAVPAAEADAARPAYHFHTPAQWMNDPNGPIYYKGWYHVFYQFNPYGAQWGNMHWGHARSKDLVNWEQMPVALWPSKAEGEDHVYSGSTFPRADGTPMAFYTSIGARDPEQWAAVSHSPDLSVWSKVPTNPVVSEKNHGAEHIAEWRDPFVFSAGHATYLLTGGGLDGRGVVLLYRAANPNLTSWSYQGVLFEHPDKAVANIECPNFAFIDGKWVLLTSTYGKVESFVGRLDLDRGKFLMEKRGVLADGSYASQLVHDAAGHVVHLAWMHTDQGKAWNGYLTLPSLLSVSPDGTLLRKPIPRLATLRGKHVQITDRPVNGAEDLTAQAGGDSLEILVDIDPGTATDITFKLRASADGARSITLRYDPATRTLFTQGREPVVLAAASGNDLKLHLFLDKGALDVYAADGAVTQAGFFADARPGDNGLQIAATGGAARIKQLDIYAMKPATFDNARFR